MILCFVHCTLVACLACIPIVVLICCGTVVLLHLQSYVYNLCVSVCSVQSGVLSLFHVRVGGVLPQLDIYSLNESLR